MEIEINEKPSVKNYFNALNHSSIVGNKSSELLVIMSESRCSKSENCDKITVKEQNSNIQKSEVSQSKTSICSCGPECGPDKCDGRNRSVLVGWDSLRTKIFICLFVAFMVWLVIYVPISLTLLGN